jgi:hypothetical protein
MDEEMREIIAQQGLGHIIALARCPDCNYIATSCDEEDSLAKKGSPCPKCGVVGYGAGIAPNNYLEVASWIGNYAAMENRRDYTSAVILFCAFVESILETLKDDYLALHPEIKLRFKADKRLLFKDVFGVSFAESVATAPINIRDFPSVWEELRDKRNRFLHGKSSYLMSRTDAHKAMDFTGNALQVYRWLNNKHCLNI